MHLNFHEPRKIATVYGFRNCRGIPALGGVTAMFGDYIGLSPNREDTP